MSTLTAPFTNALVLTGPTGSGKTGLGVLLAERMQAEIISMDSMALYRGMDVGTAKPSAQDRARVPHHLVDVLDPWESASVAWWLERARFCALDIEGRGKQVLFVGGTPLYLKAMMSGLFEGPPADAVLRLRLEQEATQAGVQSLHNRLVQVDPTSAARLHPNDVRRIVRALEVFELTGRPISAWQTQWESEGGRGTGEGGRRKAEGGKRKAESGNASPPSPAESCLDPPSAFRLPPSVLWLDIPRVELYERIDRRVQEMFAHGLVAEVERLRGLGRPLGKEASQALGYKEVFAYLDGERSLADTIALVQRRTRNFAKRQITWFRHLPNCRSATSQLTWDLWQPKMK